MPIEVELASKSDARLRAILNLHAAWIVAGKTPAVIYVCESDALATRVRRFGGDVGISVENKTLRVELLQTVRDYVLSRAARPPRETASAIQRAAA